MTEKLSIKKSQKIGCCWILEGLVPRKQINYQPF